MSTKAVTSERMATDASEALRGVRYRGGPKSLAGSVLAQARDNPLKRLRRDGVLGAKLSESRLAALRGLQRYRSPQ